ncbi:hypothetical protein ACIHCX_23555 [Streptomyces sp. NPDC052043]|uniref:hypothetical protein n=1 Tax=Streptomyces sp. NPDC052043 TaxID=3365684 RepID=UPI0037D6CB1C
MNDLRTTAADTGPEHAETERLRQALAEVAYSITPSPPPLAAVERWGRRIRRRRRAAVLGAGCGLLLVPLAVVVLRGTEPGAARATSPAAPASVSPSPSVSSTAPAPTPRVVAPGEHVTAAPGFEFWLTAEGKHWTTPSSPEPQFRSVVDGNIDRNTPGVSVQEESEDGRGYLSGLYYGGKGTASSVEVDTADGTVRGKLIELPGNPGWGVWYAITDLTSGEDPFHLDTRVTVRDTEGGVYARSGPR